jgi:transposase
MRPPGKGKTLEARRVRAIRLLKAGRTYRAVAEEVQASLSSVVRWHQAYRKSGRGALKPRSIPGRPCLLSAGQKQRLVKTLSRGALEAGYSTELWTLKRIGEVIRKRFGIRYGISNLWYLMTHLGWSCQKPTKRAKERQEAEIRYWRHHVWPHIKKGRSAWSPFGLPG